MGKGGAAVAAQKKRDESYTVAEPAASGSLKRVSPPPPCIPAPNEDFGSFGPPFPSILGPNEERVPDHPRALPLAPAAEVSPPTS
jgi:hypothetical protein